MRFPFLLLVGLLMTYSSCAQPQTADVRAQLETHLSSDITAIHMNVLYRGIKNPVLIEIEGVPQDSIQLDSIPGVEIEGEAGKYYITPLSPKPPRLNLVAHALGKKTQRTFRVKSIPNPEPRLGRQNSGSMSVGQFKAQRGVLSVIEAFDFDVQCIVQGFRLTRIAKDGSQETKINSSLRYEAAAQELVNKAAPGDIYLFEDIRAKCPGDRANRKIGSMIFRLR